MRLELEILAQALEDVLRFELGLPLTGCEPSQEEYWYEDALTYLSRHPRASERLKFLETLNKTELLREVERVRER